MNSNFNDKCGFNTYIDVPTKVLKIEIVQPVEGVVGQSLLDNLNRMSSIFMV